MNDLPQRKRLRLKQYDYSRPGYYFVTVCTRLRRENVLCIVGAAALGGPSTADASTPKGPSTADASTPKGPSAADASTPGGPNVTLTAIGEIVAQNIKNIDHVYHGQVSVDCYVIMPDHIHLVIRIHDMEMLTEEAVRALNDGVPGKPRGLGDGPPGKGQSLGDGPPRAAAPTVALPNIINALKGLTSKKAGYPLWQRGYYEHVIRNDEDLQSTRQYIQNNPLKWILDREGL